MRPVSYCRTQKAKAIEIIPLTDVSDAYNVSTGHELNEFVIRKTRHGSTLYFASPLREAIVKVRSVGHVNVRLMYIDELFSSRPYVVRKETSRTSSDLSLRDFRSCLMWWQHFSMLVCSILEVTTMSSDSPRMISFPPSASISISRAALLCLPNVRIILGFTRTVYSQ